MRPSYWRSKNAQILLLTGEGGVGLPRPPLTLRVNFLWTLAGNLVYAACQWGMLVVLAKLGTAEMVGEFALALAITAPIIIGTGLSLRGVQVTDAASDYHFGEYFALRLLTTGLALLAILGVLGFSAYGLRLAAVIFIVGIAKAFESISDILYGLLQKHERMDRISFSMMIKGPLSLAAVAVGVWFSGTLLPAVCGLATAWALILILCDIPWSADVARLGVSSPVGLMHGLRPHWRPRVLIKLALLAAPVGIVMTLISLNVNIPRYFIEAHFGTKQLGLFAALVYPMTAGVMVVNALGQAASPRLAQYYAAGDRRAFLFLLLKLVVLVVLLGLAGILLIVFFGRPILLLLYKSEYAEYVGVFLWLGIAAAIGYVGSVLGFGMTAARYFRAQLPVFLMVTLATVGACALLVPRHGLVGAAKAVTLAAVLQAAGSGAVIVHALRNGKGR